MIKFRFHRGSLEDSLATTKEFRTVNEFFTYINPHSEKYNEKYYGYDDRCKQDLTMVLINDKPIGFIIE